MQKISPFPTTKTVLPNIYGEPSRRNFRSISDKHQKENIQSENSCKEKVIHDPSFHRISKKRSIQQVNTLFQEIKQVNSFEKMKERVFTRRKLNRPWVDKQIDLNKQTMKNEHLQLLLKEHIKNDQPDSFSKKAVLQLVSDKTILNFNKTKEIILNKTKTMRTTSVRNQSSNKDKINPCKIAMKKGVFPLNKQHYEELKINEYFAREENISMISKKQCEEMNEEFISIDSYLNIVF